MDLIWLEDFLAIAEDRGFSRAAERRHVTQPALSRRIASLEKWLGTPLFERSSHTLKLTQAGETFRHTAEDVLRRILAGRQEALEVARLKAETIYVAATHALSQTFFPEWIRHAETNGPGAAIQLVAANFAACEKLLLDAQAQFLLGALSSVDHEPAGFRSLSQDRSRYGRAGADQLSGGREAWRASQTGRAALRIARDQRRAAALSRLSPGLRRGTNRDILSCHESAALLPGTELLRAGDAADRHGASGTWRHLGAAQPRCRRSRRRPTDARRCGGLGHRDQCLPVPLALSPDSSSGGILERRAQGRAGEGFACKDVAAIEGNELKRDEIRLKRHRASGLCSSMIFSENRYTLFRIMV